MCAKVQLCLPHFVIASSLSAARHVSSNAAGPRFGWGGHDGHEHKTSCDPPWPHGLTLAFAAICMKSCLDGRARTACVGCVAGQQCSTAARLVTCRANRRRELTRAGATYAYILVCVSLWCCPPGGKERHSCEI